MTATGIRNVHLNPSGRGKPYIVRIMRYGKEHSYTASTIKEAIRIKWAFEEVYPARKPFGWDHRVPPRRRSGHARWPSIAGAVLLMLCGHALAHEPGDPNADWLMQQKRPDMPEASCCGEADQYYVDSYQTNPDGSVDAQFHGETLHIPKNRIKEDSAAGNPTGRGVIWMFVYRNLDGTIRQDDGGNGSSTSRIYCFIPDIGT